jgi:hypothetical protein
MFVLWLLNYQIFSGPLGRNLKFYLEAVGELLEIFGLAGNVSKNILRKCTWKLYGWEIIIPNIGLSECEHAAPPPSFPMFCFLGGLVPQGHLFLLTSVLDCLGCCEEMAQPEWLK